ncbi:HAD hydrolase family protein [Acidithiobacillus ferrooxidans]|nr:HAD hydrolase family protein [Acidithiobacillus ferrooxidans]
MGGDTGIANEHSNVPCVDVENFTGCFADLQAQKVGCADAAEAYNKRWFIVHSSSLKRAECQKWRTDKWAFHAAARVLQNHYAVSGGLVGKSYSQELNCFTDTYRWACKQDVRRLRYFLNWWSGDHAVVVGSGGSYSAAAVGALFRELAHHSPTTAVTPLEFISTLDRLSPRTLLLSAEGRNKDILAAARAAEAADLASAAVTLTLANPLLELAHRSSALRPFAYHVDWVKDGYLATNSLLATVFLLYRAFFGDHDFEHSVGPLLDPARLAVRRGQLTCLNDLEDAKPRGLLVLHSAQAKAFAVDLESKLSEAALTSVQMTDLRQFAHGRHLQLALRSPTPFVLIASSSVERSLATATATLLPASILSLQLELEGETEQDVAVAGLIDAMFLTEALARGASHDPGQPDVPEFGRAIHALDPRELLPPHWQDATHIELAAKRKSPGGGLRNAPTEKRIHKAAVEYAARLTSARIRATVCDFDGTLCRVENRFDGMDPAHVEHISTLIRQGLSFAIATGRGNSLNDSLRASFAPDIHHKIVVGYYNGSFIARLDEDFQQPVANPEFAELWHWLKGSTYGFLAKPLDQLARGGQFSLRLASVQQCTTLRAAIGAWLDITGRHGWRVFCSGHSIDVLDAGTSKCLVVDYLASHLGINPITQILRLGDCGQEDGNDFELLREGLSLSCSNSMSSDLCSCWNFGARGNNQTDTTMSYLRALVPADGAFRISPSAFAGI